MTPFNGKQTVLAVLLGGLAALGIAVLRPFAIPVTWACIIAYLSWPLNERVRVATGNRRSLAALLMTVLLTLGLVVPTLLLVLPLAREAIALYRPIAAWLEDGPGAPDAMPWLATPLRRLLDGMAQDPHAWRVQLAQWGNLWFGEVAQLAGSIGRNAAKSGFTVLTLFFAYRDGDTFLAEVRRALTPCLGKRLDAYLVAIGDVCRSVVLGIVLTAAAQGALAGIGYWAAGVDAPLLLATVTALVALVPFGAPFVWAPTGIALIAAGHVWAGIALLAWGALAVSWIDNLVRPLVISSAARIPFLPVIFGIVGGLMAFGLIGLFLGPFVMAMLIAVWREWQAAQADGADAVPSHRGECGCVADLDVRPGGTPQAEPSRRPD
jgi:predicted PurR-regulated permease PerM